MSSLKCSRCGMYYATYMLGACPRCSRGFGSLGDLQSEEASAALGGAPAKKGPGGGMWVLLVVALVGVGALGASAMSAGNSSSYADSSYDDTSTDYSSDSTDYSTDAGSLDTGAVSDWMPYGYTAFSVNSTIASDDNYTAESCLNEGSGYCWVYQIVSQYDCSSIDATLDLTNDGTSIGQAYATIYGVTSGSPEILEIDGYDNPDVDDTTQAEMIDLVCTP